MSQLNQTYGGWQPGDIVRYWKSGKQTYRLDWVGKATVQMHTIKGRKRYATAKDLERVHTREEIINQ